MLLRSLSVTLSEFSKLQQNSELYFAYFSLHWYNPNPNPSFGLWWVRVISLSVSAMHRKLICLLILFIYLWLWYTVYDSPGLSPLHIHYTGTRYPDNIFRYIYIYNPSIKTVQINSWNQMKYTNWWVLYYLGGIYSTSITLFPVFICIGACVS